MFLGNDSPSRVSRAVPSPRGLRARAGVMLLAATCLLSTTTGCVKLLSNLIYVLKGRDVPAEYASLVEKNVAVVVNTPSGPNADVPGVTMARQVHRLLGTNVKKIKMANPDEVDQVLKDQPSGSLNMARIGQQLGVDYIVSVDLSNLQVREGQSLYRGSCDCSLAVYEMASGDRPVFRKDLPPFIYPSAGLPVTDMKEANFQNLYLSEMSKRVARTFHPFDPGTDVGIDVTAYGYNGL